jgi:hypothetical protein
MSAGTGIRHSEFNPSDTESVHFYQIWLLPNRSGVEPSYEQRLFSEEERSGRFRLVASSNGADGSLAIHQDARLYLASLAPGQQVVHSIDRERAAWIQVLRGTIDLSGTGLSAGDGAAITEEIEVAVRAASSSEVLLFDLA